MSEITDEDKLACAERELKMRKRTYPKWVSMGRMSKEKAAREIELMQAVVEDYQTAVGLFER